MLRIDSFRLDQFGDLERRPAMGSIQDDLPENETSLGQQRRNNIVGVDAISHDYTTINNQNKANDQSMDSCLAPSDWSIDDAERADEPTVNEILSREIAGDLTNTQADSINSLNRDTHFGKDYTNITGEELSNYRPESVDPDFSRPPTCVRPPGNSKPFHRSGTYPCAVLYAAASTNLTTLEESIGDAFTSPPKLSTSSVPDAPPAPTNRFTLADYLGSTDPHRLPQLPVQRLAPTLLTMQSRRINGRKPPVSLLTDGSEGSVQSIESHSSTAPSGAPSTNGSFTQRTSFTSLNSSSDNGSTKEDILSLVDYLIQRRKILLISQADRYDELLRLLKDEMELTGVPPPSYHRYLHENHAAQEKVKRIETPNTTSDGHRRNKDTHPESSPLSTPPRHAHQNPADKSVFSSSVIPPANGVLGHKLRQTSFALSPKLVRRAGIRPSPSENSLTLTSRRPVLWESERAESINDGSASSQSSWQFDSLNGSSQSTDRSPKTNPTPEPVTTSYDNKGSWRKRKEASRRVALTRRLGGIINGKSTGQTHPVFHSLTNLRVTSGSVTSTGSWGHFSSTNRLTQSPGPMNGDRIDPSTPFTTRRSSFGGAANREQMIARIDLELAAVQNIMEVNRKFAQNRTRDKSSRQKYASAVTRNEATISELKQKRCHLMNDPCTIEPDATSIASSQSSYDTDIGTTGFSDLSESELDHISNRSESVNGQFEEQGKSEYPRPIGSADSTMMHHTRAHETPDRLDKDRTAKRPPTDDKEILVFTEPQPEERKYTLKEPHGQQKVASISNKRESGPPNNPQPVRLIGTRFLHREPVDSGSYSPKMFSPKPKASDTRTVSSISDSKHPVQSPSFRSDMIRIEREDDEYSAQNSTSNPARDDDHNTDSNQQVIHIRRYSSSRVVQPKATSLAIRVSHRPSLPDGFYEIERELNVSHLPAYPSEFPKTPQSARSDGTSAHVPEFPSLEKQFSHPPHQSHPPSDSNEPRMNTLRSASCSRGSRRLKHSYSVGETIIAVKNPPNYVSRFSHPPYQTDGDNWAPNRVVIDSRSLRESCKPTVTDYLSGVQTPENYTVSIIHSRNTSNTKKEENQTNRSDRTRSEEPNGSYKTEL